MEPEKEVDDKGSWTTVGKKQPKKETRPAGDASKGMPKTSLGSRTQLDPKEEKARRKEEKEKRFNTGKKVAAAPDVISKRGGGGDSTSSDSSGSDRPGNAGPAKREKDGFKKQAPAKAPTGATSKPTGTDLQTALKKVDYKAIMAEVEKAKSSEGNDAWVRRVSERLNASLSAVPLDESMYSEQGFSWKYPLSVAPKETTSFMKDVFKGCPNNFLENYVDWCVADSCKNYLSMKKPSHGSQLILQYLCSNNPDIFSFDKNDERVAEVRRMQSKDETLGALWSYGQSGLSSFAKGFDIWIKMMFPLLNNRVYTGFVVAYLEKLLENHKKHDFSKVDKPTVFLNVFDGFFGTNTIHFHKSTKAKMNNSYMVLREELFKDKLKDSAETYFAHFLMRLTMQQPKEYQQKARENLLLCLRSNQACFDLWRKKYPTNLKESQIVLQHIVDNDDEDVRAVRKLPEFHKFLNFVENYEFVDDNGKSTLPENIQDETDQTVEITKKLKRQIKKEKSRTGWKKFFWFLVLLAAAVAGEVSYNTPERSYAVKAYAVSRPVVEQYWTKAKPFINHTWEDYVKPFSYMAAVQTGKAINFTYHGSIEMWSNMKTQLPQVYAGFLFLESYAQQTCEQFWKWVYIGLRKLDDALVDMPPLSQLGEKIQPAVEFSRKMIMDFASYIGNMVQSYISSDSSSTSGRAPSAGSKHT
ncbi:hypothetical protein RvY_03180 [Ramazzottius varieornatus]|uniref:Uncharacterized protein n=1 Tax=Ramazzottius varieornatus TaxID=947166 RepID=A0A1D1UU80_RAMVA|nr:hypothetical protein RvY_03180 [Ramazzottius varieornatus]